MNISNAKFLHFTNAKKTRKSIQINSQSNRFFHFENFSNPFKDENLKIIWTFFRRKIRLRNHVFVRIGDLNQFVQANARIHIHWNLHHSHAHRTMKTKWLVSLTIKFIKTMMCLISPSLFSHAKLLKYSSLFRIIGNRSTRKDEDDSDQYPNNYVFLWYTQLFIWHVCVFFLPFVDIQQISIPHFYYSSLHSLSLSLKSQKMIFNKCIAKKCSLFKMYTYEIGLTWIFLKLVIDFHFYA